MTLERAATQVTAIEAYLSTGAAAVVSSGTYTLIDSSGAVVIDAAVVTTPVSGGAEYEILASAIPATTAPLGAGWQERWTLTMASDSTTHTVRRVAAMARFQLHPCVADVDLTGIYPDLIDDLGNYASNLGSWLDDAWARVMRQLWKNGDFPHILVESSDVYEWVRQEALTSVFRALFKSSNGADERWERLWNDHAAMAAAEASSCRITVDRDQDGTADHDGKDKAGPGKSVHWGHPFTTDPRAISSRYR